MEGTIIDRICGLTADETRLIAKLGPVAEEAHQLAEDVGNAYVFKIGQKTVDLPDAGTLTHDGVWQISINSGDTVQVECTEEGIFEMLRKEYLINNKYIKPTEEERLEIDAFRRFANYTRKLLNQMVVSMNPIALAIEPSYPHEQAAQDNLESQLTQIPIGTPEVETVSNIHAGGAGIPEVRVTSRRIFPSGQNVETTEIPALMQKTGETVDEQAEDQKPVLPKGFIDAYVADALRLYSVSGDCPNPEDNPGGKEQVFYTSC